MPKIDHRRARQTTLWALAVTQLVGCASIARNMSGPMRADDAKSYAHLKPPAFVRKRFYDEEISGFQDGVDSFLDKMMAFQAKAGSPNPHQGKERKYRPSYLEKEGVVVWPAYFTDVNHNLLERPVGDLQSYCETVSHGRWRSIQTYDQDPIAESMTAPLTAYVGAERASFAYLERQNGYNGYRPAEAAIAANAAQEVAQMTAERNAGIAHSFSWQGFREAKARGAFGLFRCEAATERSWFASILPTVLWPKGNDRPATLARIALRVYAQQNGSSP